jgi:hypothetical protein
MPNGIVKLTGVTFGDVQKNIKMFGCKDIGSFAMVREPNNAADPNAIRVQIGNIFLGYIPQKIAKRLAPRIDLGENYLALFIKRNEPPFHRGYVGLTVQIVHCLDDGHEPYMDA